MQPFIKQNLEESQDIITVRLNPEERDLLNKCKKILEQPKDSTAIKQMMMLSSYVIHDNLTSNILGVVFANKRRNKRTGIIEYDN